VPATITDARLPFWRTEPVMAAPVPTSGLMSGMYGLVRIYNHNTMLPSAVRPLSRIIPLLLQHPFPWNIKGFVSMSQAKSRPEIQAVSCLVVYMIPGNSVITP
jgi:hypothetical protein